jgi:hypothetical protein
VEANKYLLFNDNFIGRRNTEDIESNGNIYLKVKKWFGDDEYQVSSHPYDYVLIKFKNDVTLGGSKFAAGETYKLPALFVYTLFAQDTREKWLISGRTTFDAALFIIGVGEVKVAVQTGSWIRAGLAVADMGIGFVDIAVNDIFEKEVKTKYPSFYERWQKIALIYGIGRLTQVGLEALVQSTYKECKTLETVADLSQESKDAIVRAEKKLESEFGGMVKGTTSLASTLTGELKSTYDALVKAGLKLADDGLAIRFFDNAGNEIAIIQDGAFAPKKWLSTYKNEVVSKTETGYWLVKKGDEYGFDLGYREGREFSAEYVNQYHSGVGHHEPYKQGTKVFERNLQPGDKVYIVEYKFPAGSKESNPNPGGWGTKNKVLTIKELREDLVVLEAWKQADKQGGLVVREYTVIKPLPVRDGVTGPLREEGDLLTTPVYQGGAQQYEFIESLRGNGWESYLSIKDKNGIELK